MHLVGLDIGFSERRRTNAMAIFRDGALAVPKPMSAPERDAALRALENVDVIAIDAPVLPPGTPETLQRVCERIFSQGRFQKRCKPGMSHVAGTGRQLRAHGRQAADQVTAAKRVVEAFPNAFLGVGLPEEVFADQPRGRGKKFDWLYDQWIARGLFRRAGAAAQLPDEIAAACETAKNHDIRGALVCLLTAAFAALGTAALVGFE